MWFHWQSFHTYFHTINLTTRHLKIYPPIESPYNQIKLQSNHFTIKSRNHQTFPSLISILPLPFSIVVLVLSRISALELQTALLPYKFAIDFPISTLINATGFQRQTFLSLYFFPVRLTTGNCPFIFSLVTTLVNSWLFVCDDGNFGRKSLSCQRTRVLCK